MLEALGNIGDFIGGIAVVITLVYLAFQIRHNTAAVETASRQDVTAGFREWNRLTLDPKNAAALAAGMRRYPNLDLVQMKTFSAIVNDQSHHLESAFALYEAGALKNEIFDAYLNFFCAVVSTPGGAVWWAEIGSLHIAELVSCVDARLSQGDLPNLLDFAVFAEQPTAEKCDHVKNQ